MDAAADEAGLPGATGRCRRVALAAEPSIRIGPILVDPPSRRVLNDDGREAIVDPRSMKVLVALLRFPSSVFSRDELFDCCWEGRFVTDDAVDRAVLRLRRSIAPVVDDMIVVETVTKVGHRAVVHSCHGLSEPKQAAAPEGKERVREAWMPAALVLAAVLLASLFWVALPRYDPPRDTSVGILPFAAAAAEETGRSLSASAIRCGATSPADPISTSSSSIPGPMSRWTTPRRPPWGAGSA